MTARFQTSSLLDAACTSVEINIGPLKAKGGGPSNYNNALHCRGLDPTKGGCTLCLPGLYTLKIYQMFF